MGYSEEFQRLYNSASCITQNWDWSSATNRWFDPDSSCSKAETYLVSELTSEAYNLAGMECQYYMYRFDTSKDPIFGEDPTREIIRRFVFTVYSSNLPTFQKNYEIQGMIYEEMFTVQATIAHFKEASRYSYNPNVKLRLPVYQSIEPAIGDLIYFDKINIYYEIINVKKFATDSTFLTTPITYEFILRVWRNDQQDTNPEDKNDKMEDLIDYQKLSDVLGVNNDLTTLHKDNKYVISGNERTSDIDPFNGWEN